MADLNHAQYKVSLHNVSYYYLCQGGYAFVVVCLLPTLCNNFQMDLHETFREGWQWANEQMIKFW